ncbi:hypothetical protein DIPPA_08022 [Diplonema papillatum]|nr:hypothetical protein DIPPA_08022 [Diplonema papillatum]
MEHVNELIARTTPEQRSLAKKSCVAVACLALLSRFSVRGVLVGGLDVFRRVNLFLRWLRGETAESVAERKLASGEAWADFCDTLKAAGAALSYPGAPQDGRNQAEGHRYLTRLVRAGLACFMENADPRSPVLHRMLNETVKMFSDNPDNWYYTACVRGQYRYVITGKRNTIKYISFGATSGVYGRGAGMKTVGFVEGSELEMDAEGRFSIFVGPERSPDYKNWLQTNEECTGVYVRMTFGRKDAEVPSDLDIKRIGDTDGKPSPITAEAMVEALESTSGLVAGASFMFAKMSKQLSLHSNALPLYDPAVLNQAGGDPNILYHFSHWHLAADEALLVEVAPVECEYWNFQINNYWMESLDYRHFDINTNKFCAKYEKDGKLRIAVASQQPGPSVQNWLNTCGHLSGTMLFRWVKAKEDRNPSCRVVKFSEIAN